eukprot:1411350-Prymnesium_polylepis.1
MLRHRRHCRLHVEAVAAADHHQRHCRLAKCRLRRRHRHHPLPLGGWTRSHRLHRRRRPPRRQAASARTSA